MELIGIKVQVFLRFKIKNRKKERIKLQKKLPTLSKADNKSGSMIKHNSNNKGYCTIKGKLHPSNVC